MTPDEPHSQPVNDHPQSRWYANESLVVCSVLTLVAYFVAMDMSPQVFGTPFWKVLPGVAVGYIAVFMMGACLRFIQHRSSRP